MPTSEPIDTETPGTYTFTVNSTDNAGNRSTRTHTYTVKPAIASPLTPVSKDDCKDNGWRKFVDDDEKSFKNQGECIKFVSAYESTHPHYKKAVALLLV